MGGSQTLTSGMSTITDFIAKLDAKPDRQSPDYRVWVDQEDFLDFLRHQQGQDEVILYACLTHCFLYGVAIPRIALDPIPVDDLLDWSCDPCSTWGLCYGFRQGSSEQDMWIEPPLSTCGSKTLERGEQLIFIRDFAGYRENSSYVELSQKVAHLLGLHFVSERAAYCRLDDNGDLEDVVRIQRLKKDGLAVTIRRADLDLLLVMFESSYVLLFDSTRFDSGNFRGWGDAPENYASLDDACLNYRGRTNPGCESYIHGFQVFKPVLSETLRMRLMGKSPEPKQYVSFVAHDWKHDCVCDCSCDPERLGNYFVPSDLPFETSPAFFRPDVLSKYKADPDKYKINSRHIHCRGAWSLKSFDINEIGQVHAYLCDLSLLPYAEQLYWKSFNEAPKGSISLRAFKSDFLAQWSTDYDPLASLKRRLEALSSKGTTWWTLRNSQLLDRVHYPVTTSQEEWANELIALDQMLNEGFSRSYFKAKAQEAGIEVDPQWRSLKLITEVLAQAQINDDEVAAIVNPLKSLSNLRNKMKGHAAGTETKKIRDELITQHGDLKTQFRYLTEQCDKSIALMNELAESGVF